MQQSVFNYCLAHDGCVAIPIEALAPAGIDPACERLLLDSGAMQSSETALFNQAYALYWQRMRRLYKKAPQYWFPPRRQHICIATDSKRVRPYFQPFNKNSWLLYRHDFDPATSSLEFAVYQFLHVERMWQLQQLDPVLNANFSYFLTLSDAEINDFIDGCQRTTRPDAAAFRALADAMPAVRKLYHQPLKKPAVVISQLRAQRNTGLLIPADVIAALTQLQQTWSQTTVKVSNAFQARHQRASSNPGQPVIEWLVAEKPPLVITGANNRIVWDPEQTSDTGELRTLLAEVSQSAEPDILLDLQTIAHHTARFLRTLRQPEALTDPAPYMTPGGLSHIDKNRKLIAYDLGPGRNQARLWQPTPPYERLMLAARTVHEWGHLAAESGWVIISPGLQNERNELETSLAELFDQIHARAPIKLQQRVAGEVARLSAETGSLGQTLLKRMLVRIEDFMANLVAARFLSGDEMDTYVRNNVHSHVHDYSAEGVYMQLIRQAYEFQYLHLSRVENPLDWFYGSTWFIEYFVDNGIVSKALFEQLTDIVNDICSCYQLDETKFNFDLL